MCDVFAVVHMIDAAMSQPSVVVDDQRDSIGGQFEKSAGNVVSTTSTKTQKR